MARIATLRSTVHTHTADGCRAPAALRPAGPRPGAGELPRGAGRRGLGRLTAVARELVEAEPRTMAQLREALGATGPDADPRAPGPVVPDMSASRARPGREASAS
ncbi:hypothetical protein LT493_31985 [Streptomyces tricolor]|nr:hypothetical protein [Streptomyces tricolor]